MTNAKQTLGDHDLDTQVPCKHIKRNAQDQASFDV